LTAAGRLGDIDLALAQAVGQSAAEIEQNWRRFLRSRRFNVVPGAPLKHIVLVEGDSPAEPTASLAPIVDKETSQFARLGELLALRGQKAAAVIEYEKAYARAQLRYPSLIYQYAHALIEAGRLDGAKKTLDGALAVFPGDGDLRLLAGRIALKQDNVSRARAQFEAARMQNPYNPEIHLALGALYEKDGLTKMVEQEKRFLALSKNPRPSRHYTAPLPGNTETGATIVTEPWGVVRIDNGPDLQSPIWRLALPAGTHALEFRRPNGASVRQSVEVKSGQVSVVVLR
jgi:tetratricopeptide (TPR) repeat protein